MRTEHLTRSHFFDAIANRADTVIGTFDMMIRAVDVYTMPRHGVVFIEDGRIYAIAGICPVWEGCGEAWAIPTKLIGDKKIAVARRMKLAFNDVAAELKMHRVQAAVRLGHKEAHRLAKFVGMTEEGVMRKYGPDGADYMRYASWPTQ